MGESTGPFLTRSNLFRPKGLPIKLFFLARIGESSAITRPEDLSPSFDGMDVVTYHARGSFPANIAVEF